MNAAAFRRLLHSSTALFLLLNLLDIPGLLRAVLSVGAVVAVVVDSMRMVKPRFGRLVKRLVPVFRHSEATQLSGASWLMVGLAAAAWFPHPAATAGILAGALADPAASQVGSTIARPDAGKSWVGTAAAAAVAALVLLPTGVPLAAVLCGAVAAATLERWPGPFNDNLVVAPGVALVVWIAIRVS